MKSQDSELISCPRYSTQQVWPQQYSFRQSHVLSNSTQQGFSPISWMYIWIYTHSLGRISVYDFAFE